MARDTNTQPKATLVLPPGNGELRQRLAELGRRQHLHHCMIFEGPGGVGKAASARWLAMLMNCHTQHAESGPRTQPCGTCWSCRHIALGEHPDVILVGLDPERTTPIISVRQARELIGALSLHPFSADLRFVIIDPADAMTAEAASALLKTFEEPPAQTIFVLISQRPMDLLGTVRSRSQRVRFRPVSDDDVVAWLQQQAAKHTPAKRRGAVAQWVDSLGRQRHIAALADGCPDRATTLAGGEFDTWLAARKDLLQAIALTLPERLTWTEKLCRGERARVMERVGRLMDVLERVLRDVLLRCADPCVGAEGGKLGLYNPDRSGLIEDWAARLGTGGVTRIDQALTEARRDLAANVNTRLAMDALLAAITAQLGPPRSRAD